MNRLPQRSSLVSQAAAILKERIQAGEWRKWLPGEHELSAQLHVARMTVRRALDQLQHAGLVRVRQGRRREILKRARRVAPASSGRVLLLTPAPLHFMTLFDAFWASALRERLEESGFHLEVHPDRGPYGRGLSASLARIMAQLRPVGFVLLNSTQNMQTWFSRRKLPCVIVGTRHPGIELPSVDKAHRAVCRHAVGLFLARDHRRLVLFNPESGAAGDLESEAGFNEGIAHTAHDDVQGSIVRHEGTVADICQKLNLLFRRPDRPTALLVSRSLNVLTVMGHLMRNSIRLPQDVALISRDHDQFMEKMVPSVARYLASPEALAARISAVVLEIVQSGLVSPATFQIMPEFIDGETLGLKVSPAHPTEPRVSGHA